MPKKSTPGAVRRAVAEAVMKLGTDEAPSVASYFLSQLGRELDVPDQLCTRISIASPCGASCKGAIDAAATLLAHVRAAIGSRDPRAVATGNAIIRAAETTVRVYVYG